LQARPLWERLPRWGLLGLLVALALGMLVPMLWLRRRHEQEADTFAVSQYGAEPLISTRSTNSPRCSPATPQRVSDALHPSLHERLQRLQRFQPRLPA
jgi:Zn-dependent protease with chaperone function